MLTPAGGELPERRGGELLERRGVQLGNYLNADTRPGRPSVLRSASLAVVSTSRHQRRSGLPMVIPR
jgi:hypothetical protein